MARRKKLKRDKKGHFLNDDGKVPMIRGYIENIIYGYISDFPDVSIDDLELLLYRQIPSAISVRKIYEK